jgi:ABC-2 type transport system ATP-binding protein
LIRVEGLSRRYGRFEAVRGVSFFAGKGEVVGLLGQNGAGKTTVMNVLAGVLAPSSGQVSVMDHDIVRQPELAKPHIGYLPETPPLYPELTVKEYLCFCCSIKCVDRAGMEKHINEIIGLTDLKEVENQLIGRLSKGFRQRAGMAQALCGDPEVLLLDEPTGGFDPLQALAFRKLVRKLAREKTIIFSSHLLCEVQAICDRVLILHEGRLVLDHKARSEEGQMPQYRLSIAAQSARVLSPIRGLASVCRVHLLSDQNAKTTRMLVDTETDSAFHQELFTLLTGLNAPILELTPIEEPLEALFIKATAGQQRGK